MASHAAEKGQRTYTSMIYLNDVAEGGETLFLNVGARVSPRAGTAVIWSSLKPDGSPNADSIHQALPVVKGYKAVITNWFRSSAGTRKPPPMFMK
jgi:prolyl 4-hydroxylase